LHPLDFLAAVLPSAGDYYCVAELSSIKKDHFFTKDLNEIPPKVAEYAAADHEIYFALASFEKAGARTAANAVNVRSFFVDLDCAKASDKTYATKKEGLAAFVAFLQKTGLDELGTPFIVDSGGGFHVYWPLTEDAPISKWKPVAENFKRLCKQEGLKIDMNVTADAARVLRIPGTINHKREPHKTVTIKAVADPIEFDFDAFANMVRSKLNVLPVETTNVFDLPGVRPTKPSSNIDPSAFKNSVTYFKKIINKTKEGTGCGQIAHYIENAADDGMEPMWRAVLSISYKCEDGDKWNKRLSALHPYTEERMQQKLREIRGPYPCTKFDSENPGICTGCKHWGKITNPLALGRDVAVSYEEKQIEVPVVSSEGDIVEEAAPVVHTRPVPPRGYAYGEKGGIFREVEDEDADGKKSKRRVEILRYDLFVVDVMNANGEHSVHMVAMRPEGAVDVILPQKATVSKDETVKCLASQNILASFGSGNDKNLFEYVRAAVEAFSSSRKATKIPASYGWQPDGSFVHNNTIYFPTSVSSSPRSMPMPGLENLYNATRPQGDIEHWRAMWNLMITKEHYELLTMACVGFGSPLMAFTGLHGMTFHLGSTESGTGKTLALQMAASIWGHPDRYRVGKATSDVAMLQRAGLLNSLPLISDEITAKNRKDMEWFPAFMFDYSEGQGKDRMESGANKERLNTTLWKGLSLMSSNTHVTDYMTGARKHSSEGELRRMLELTPTKQLEWTADEESIIMAFGQNYGMAGPLFARWLAQNRETAKNMVVKVRLRLKAMFHARGDERYWVAGAAAVVAGAILAGSKYANIIDLPVEKIMLCLKAMIEKARGIMKASVRTAEDILNSYIREYYGNFVVLTATPDGIGASFGNGGLIDQTTMRSDVAGRVEHNTAPGFTDFYIEEQLLKAYCSSMSFGYADFKRQLEAMYRTTYMRKDMMSRTKGPPMRVNVMRINRPNTDDDLATEIAA
jgi:hypothetical protein